MHCYIRSSLKICNEHFLPDLTRCRDGGLINQALIGRHTYDGDCSCSVVLNGNTWNETHTFPIAAAIDNKVDGNVESQLTVKLRVKGFVVQSQKITVS